MFDAVNGEYIQYNLPYAQYAYDQSWNAHCVQGKRNQDYIY